MRNYSTAPLPFQGQKRRFIKPFKQALNSFKRDSIYIDLFGGSGLLSHTVKQHYPEANVIWNDYDNYAKRLAAIPNTNVLIAKLRVLLANCERKGKMPDYARLNVLELIKMHEAHFGYLDYVTLSANLLFSGKFATCFEELAKNPFYNRIRLTEYVAMDYLKGVERVQMDYKALYSQYKAGNVVYLVDPPYLSTDISSYGNKDYWRLRDYLDVLSVLDGSNYFYFTSNKSQVVELCEWIETRAMLGNPFAGSTVSTTSNSINYSSSYTDIMLYKQSPD